MGYEELMSSVQQEIDRKLKEELELQRRLDALCQPKEHPVSSDLTKGVLWAELDKAFSAVLPTMSPQPQLRKSPLSPVSVGQGLAAALERLSPLARRGPGRGEEGGANSSEDGQDNHKEATATSFFRRKHGSSAVGKQVAFADVQIKQLYLQLTSALKAEVTGVQQQLWSQVEELWGQRWAQMEAQLVEQTTALQRQAEATKGVVMDLSGRLTSFQCEVQGAVAAYNKHVRGIIDQLKGLVMEEVQKFHARQGASEQSQAQALSQLEGRLRLLHSSVAADVNALHKVLGDSVDALQGHVQSKLCKLDGEVLRIAEKRAGLQAAQCELQAEVLRPVTERLCLVEQELSKTTALLLQLAGRQRQLERCLPVSSPSGGAGNSAVLLEVNAAVDNLHAQMRDVTCHLQRLDRETSSITEEILKRRPDRGGLPRPEIPTPRTAAVPEQWAREGLEKRLSELEAWAQDARVKLATGRGEPSAVLSASARAACEELPRHLAELTSRVSALEDGFSKWQGSPRRAPAGSADGEEGEDLDGEADGVPRRVREYVDDIISSVGAELSQLRTHVRTNIEPQLQRLMLSLPQGSFESEPVSG